MKHIHTDPRLVREVLDELETSSTYAIGKARGIHPKTITRWKRKRAEDPAWPSDEFIARWLREREERAEYRRRRMVEKRDYVKRVYLNRGRLQVDPTGTVRRLRALYAIGWTSTDLAPRLGVTPGRVGHIVAGRMEKVHPTTAERVARVYDELSMIVPQDPPTLPARHIRIHDRQRRQSAAKGWAPPLAWDDIDNDPAPAIFGFRNIETTFPTKEATRAEYQDIDPVVVDRVLAGQRIDTVTRAERTEIVRRWRLSGRPLVELQQLTGWKPERYYTPGSDPSASAPIGTIDTHPENRQEVA